MERCPTCNARYSGTPVCHRCKTDLSPLTDIENKAYEHLRQAISEFHAENFDMMFFHAKRSFSLRRTPEAEKLFACASLLVKKYDLAMSVILFHMKHTGLYRIHV